MPYLKIQEELHKDEAIAEENYNYYDEVITRWYIN